MGKFARLSALGFFAALALVMSLFGGVTANAANDASISGKVTTANGQPLQADANGSYGRVTVTWPGPSGYSAASAGPFSEMLPEASVAADGSYTINGLSPGSYIVEFHPPTQEHAGQWWDNKPDWVSATTLKLKAGESRTGVDAQLALGASISGTVTGADGKPLELTNGWNMSGYAVAFQLLSNGTYQRAEKAPITVDGSYEFRGLPAGTYKVRFEPFGSAHPDTYWGDVSELELAASLSLTAGQSHTDIDTQLPVGASISGKVTGANGEPLVAGKYSMLGAVHTMKLSAEGRYMWKEHVEIEEDGSYTISGLSAGTYKVEFRPYDGVHEAEWWENKPDEVSATPITLTASQALVEVDAELALAGEPTTEPTPTPTAGVLVNTVRPSVSGFAVVGASLRAKPGSWSVADAKFAYQWFVGGQKVSGATASSLKLTKAHVGKTVRVEVTASKAGSASVKALSSSTGKVAYASSLSVKAAAKSKGKVEFAVVVKSNKSAARGKVAVYFGSKKLKTVSLNSKGKATVKLSKQAKGKKSYTIKYLGYGTAAPVSKTVKVTVK